MFSTHFALKKRILARASRVLIHFKHFRRFALILALSGAFADRIVTGGVSGAYGSEWSPSHGPQAQGHTAVIGPYDRALSLMEELKGVCACSRSGTLDRACPDDRVQGFKAEKLMPFVSTHGIVYRIFEKAGAKEGRIVSRFSSSAVRAQLMNRRGQLITVLSQLRQSYCQSDPKLSTVMVSKLPKGGAQMEISETYRLVFVQEQGELKLAEIERLLAPS